MAASASMEVAVAVPVGRMRRSGSVALGDLLRREAATERASAAGERPTVAAGQAARAKKGEDLTLLKPVCERHPGAPFSAFALFDGHNGSAAAVYAKENLLNNVLCCVPSDLSGDEWLAALPRALVAGFVKTDKEFQTRAHSSGTTVTLVIIDGSVVTVASVGDSRCVLEAEGSIYHLSADHRFDASEEEVGRVTECGCEVGRLNVVGGAEIGPLRCWPGGLCLSRSIGDQDVGEFIIPVPFVKQIKLSTAGSRIIISSDGVWDALTTESAFSCARGLPPEAAADQIVKEAVESKGLRDDTTCIVVDITPPKKLSPVAQPPKKAGKGVLKNIFHRKTISDSPSHGDKLTSGIRVSLMEMEAKIDRLLKMVEEQIREKIGGRTKTRVEELERWNFLPQGVPPRGHLPPQGCSLSSRSPFCPASFAPHLVASMPATYSSNVPRSVTLALASCRLPCRRIAFHYSRHHCSSGTIQILHRVGSRNHPTVFSLTDHHPYHYLLAALHVPLASACQSSRPGLRVLAPMCRSLCASLCATPASTCCWPLRDAGLCMPISTCHLG
ncbi:hypothetical protein GUJ93_ZPchr0014g47487 [Zizania palustris]|uniref:protein-serine/threonine phosphatase n=1 Tax=Zizania palustris TaxID=103762 RepID=A0A8J5SWX0_ZIZPA|nr:hypothetical protein GUJ93_ZPchr0014g47487 [Zizania palustris]